MHDWPHAPMHRFAPFGFYFVTASTYGNVQHFRRRVRLDALRDLLFRLALMYDVTLQAGALMSNHYHLVVYGTDHIRTMLSEFHRQSAISCNTADDAPGRQVWFQYRDTQLTYERSWMARMRYTVENPVHHGLVTRSSDYPWCSAAWFERNASRAFAESLRNFKIDRVTVRDDFDVIQPE